MRRLDGSFASLIFWMHIITALGPIFNYFPTSVVLRSGNYSKY